MSNPASRRNSATELRRNSATELLSPTTDVKSPRYPLAQPAFAPPRRRESLKDQLVKLKNKAGQILEAASMPSTPSASVAPSTINFPQADPSSITPEIQLSVPERASTSPTPSQSSKKTSSSDLRANLRGRIREQAQSLVERTRGAVQLNRRLERRASASHGASNAAPVHIESDDVVIESAIEKGEKYMKWKEKKEVLSEIVQEDFFTAVHEKEKEKVPQRKKQPLAAYEGARMAAVTAEDLLVVYPSNESIQPDAVAEEGRLLFFWQKQPSTNYSRLLARLGGDVPLEITWKTSPTITRIDTEDTENIPSAYYLGPLNEEIAPVGMTVFDEMDVDVGRIIFLHHWIFSEEDSAAAQLRGVYEEQVEAAIEVADLVKELLKEDNTESVQKASVAHDNFLSLGRKTEEAAMALQEIRIKNGYSSNPLQYNPGEEDQSLLSLSSLGRLTSTPRETLPETLPPTEKHRIAHFARLRYQLLIHFNGILAVRTPTRSLSADGVLSFKQIYSLKVYSPPERLTVTLLEKAGRSWKTLVVMDIPVPSSSERVNFASGSAFPSALGSLGAGDSQPLHGFLECGVKWKEEKKEESEPEESAERGFYLFHPDCLLDDDESFTTKIDEQWAKRRFREEEHVVVTTAMRSRLDREREAAQKAALVLRKQLILRLSETAKVLEDYVREEPLPSISFAIQSLFGPSDVSRKLKPMRKEQLNKPMATTATNRLMVNIQSALRLPGRANGTPLQAFVLLRVGEFTQRTSTSSGSNAHWQNTLVVEDVSQAAVIHLEVFDELFQPLPSDSREENSRHEQALHRFLGSVTVNVADLTAKMDGFLRLKTPIFAAGYRVEAILGSFLKVLIALDPLAVKHSQPSGNVGAESDEVQKLRTTWWSTASAAFPDRPYLSSVLNSEGKAVIPCRYLRGVGVPPSLETLRQRPAEFVTEATRLVSLLPLLEDQDDVLARLPYLWSTLEQLLSLECGSKSEHAVLLCCWCLWAELPVTLLIGRSAPLGDHAAFVFLQLPDVNAPLIMDPCQGRVYSSDDQHLSLQSVHTAVTPSNVYANLQKSTQPTQISYDFTKKADWLPMFGKERAAFSSVQPDSIPYTVMDEDSLVEIRSSIERELKLKIDESRAYGIPQWNLLAARMLREALSPHWTSTLDEAVTRLSAIFSLSLSVVSSPLNTTAQCSSEVLASRFQVNAHPDAQFALAVHIAPAYNTTATLTVAFALLCPKDTVQS